MLLFWYIVPKYLYTELKTVEVASRNGILITNKGACTIVKILGVSRFTTELKAKSFRTSLERFKGDDNKNYIF